MKLQVHTETPSNLQDQGPGRLLTEMEAGAQGRIRGFTHSRLSGKFISMGILPGAYIRLIRKMPFSGSYYLQVNNSFFALRKQEAATIILGK